MLQLTKAGLVDLLDTLSGPAVPVISHLTGDTLNDAAGVNFTAGSVVAGQTLLVEIALNDPGKSFVGDVTVDGVPTTLETSLAMTDGKLWSFKLLVATDGPGHIEGVFSGIASYVCEVLTVS